MLTVRPNIEKIFISGTTRESTEKFIDSLTIKDQKINVGSPEETAACDLVCSCTSSKEPVIPTKSVKPGAHLNLIGSFSDAQKEADSELIQNAEIFVDHRTLMESNFPTELGNAYRSMENSGNPWGLSQGD